MAGHTYYPSYDGSPHPVPVGVPASTPMSMVPVPPQIPSYSPVYYPSPPGQPQMFMGPGLLGAPPAYSGASYQHVPPSYSPGMNFCQLHLILFNKLNLANEAHGCCHFFI